MSLLSVRIGARSSRLSQAQTAIVSDLIKKRFGDDLALEYVPVKTLGDLTPPSAKKDLGRAGAKGAFTGDIETLLLEGKIDIAIHSMKDLTSEETDGLVIGATPPRSDPRDALVAIKNGTTIGTLPERAKVGTSSLRRRVQLLKLRPDLRVVDLHGNVDTRLRKVGGDPDGFNAIVLAAAGLQRIGEGARISQAFSIEEMVPAVGQGIIAVQMRRDDGDIGRVLSQIDDEVTAFESRCERAFARRLGADCNLPVGGCAKVSGQTITMVGMVAKEDGSGLRHKSVSGPSAQAVSLGSGLAEELLDGAPNWTGAAS